MALFSRSKNPEPVLDRSDPSGALISLRQVEKSFAHGTSRTWVLRRISFDIQPGEFVSIMGPSGAGKSTLLHIIGMHDSEWTGEYGFAGQPVHRLSPKDRAQLHKATHRIRLPELPPAGSPDGLREPGSAALLSRRQEGGARQPGVRHARPVQHRRQEGPVPEPAVGRAAATRRRGPRGHCRTEGRSWPTSPPATCIRARVARSWSCSRS